MGIIVKLRDIIDGMQMQSGTLEAYLDKRTGEVIPVSEDELAAAEEGELTSDSPAWQREAVQKAREILTTQHYIPLPDPCDINEYGMMQDFCYGVEDDKIRNLLLIMIKGPGAFSRFKAALDEFNLTEKWYQYRDEAFRQIALSWCEANGITIDPA